MSYPHYPDYKVNNVQGLGKVPSHWKVLPLKTVSTHNDDVLIETTAPDAEISYVDISSVDGVNGIKTKESMLFSAAPSRARRLVKHGDVIISTVRTYLKAIARIRDPEDNLVVSTGFAVIRPCSELTPDFLGCLVFASYFVDQVIARSTGVSYPAINASELVAISVPVPPLKEQIAIASFVDRETAKIDELAKAFNGLIDLLKEKRQAVISHAVTKGLDSSVQMKDSGIEWFGQMPIHWVVLPLSRTSTEPGSVFIDGDWIESKDISEDGVRYLTSGNVGSGKYKEQGQGFISDATFNALNCTEVLPGDVLISRLNLPIGRACIAPELGGRIVTCVDNVIVRSNKEFDRRFLVYMLTSKAHFSNMETLASGTTMQRISRSKLGRVRFAFPPTEEQNRIADVLDREIAALDRLMRDVASTMGLLKERRTALISAAVTGKIDVRGLVNLVEKEKILETA